MNLCGVRTENNILLVEVGGEDWCFGGSGMTTGGVGTCGVGALAGGVSKHGMLQGCNPDTTGRDLQHGILLILPRGHGLGQVVGGSVGMLFLASITLMGSVGFSKDRDK